MPSIKQIATCKKWDCFAYEGGNCTILTDNNFGKRECPFYKTKEQVEKEQAYCKERMNQIAIKKKEEK